MKRIGFLILIVLSMLALPGAIIAQNHIKDSLPAPDGTSVLSLYYFNNTANVNYADGHDSILNFSQTSYMWRAAHFWGWGDGKWAACANVLVPFSSTETNDERISGLGDLMASGAIFYQIIPNYWILYSVIIGAPTADYDKNKTSNIGSNWWYYHNEVAWMSYQSGNWLYEGYFDADFYTENDDYNNGSEIGKLKKDPLLYTQAFVTYDWNKIFSTGIRYVYYNGGETKFKGVSNGKIEKHNLMFEATYQLTTGIQLALGYAQDFAVEDGVKVTTAQARLAYSW